jgi:hypothetical protein
MSKAAWLAGVSALGLMALTPGPASAGDWDDWSRGQHWRYWYPYHYTPYQDYPYRYYQDPYQPYAYSYPPYHYGHHEDENEDEED